MALRGILTHRKTRKLARALGICPAFAVGLLEAMWHVTAEQQVDGGIGRMANQDIADEMFYDGDADALIEALIACGWLEPMKHCRLYVHDWHEHADDAVQWRILRARRRFASGAESKRAKHTSEPPTATDGAVQSAMSTDDDRQCQTPTVGDWLPVPVPVPANIPPQSPPSGGKKRRRRAAPARTERVDPMAEPQQPEPVSEPLPLIPEAAQANAWRWEDEALPVLRERLDEESFGTWFTPLRCLGLTATQAWLGVATAFYRNWLVNNYLDQITDVLSELTGREVEVRICVVGVEEAEEGGAAARAGPVARTG